MAKSKPSLIAPSTAIDPTLNALFASSFGPVTAPSKDRYAEILPRKERQSAKHSRNKDSAVETGEAEGDDDGDDDDDEQDDESLSEIDDDDEEVPEELSKEEQEAEEETEANARKEAPAESPKTQRKDRKRKRKGEHDDIEGDYMRKLAKEEEREDRQEKRRKGDAGETVETAAPKSAEDSEPQDGGDGDDDEAPMVHESLQKPEEHVDVELDKANRTLFLGNVSIEAITSSKAKKTLISHLEAPLSELDSSTGPHELESLRFRSTPFATGAKPKRASFITKSVMSATTKSTNAYVVYSTRLACRTALKALNGSVILDRHLRVDSVAHPAAVDHRRCIFVGNLGFVDDETVVNTTAEGETVTKKRHKVPADTEEGLWRIFGQHAGKVESVRVPRDDKTRVGKGFAYVQFYDGNDVESAMLLDGKKFPPMLPRALRVSRAKDPRKTALAMERTAKARIDPNKSADGKLKSTRYAPKMTPEQLSQAGRASKLFGRAAATKQYRGSKRDRKRSEDKANPVQENGDGIKPPEQFIFEGRRASAKDGKPRDLKFGKTKGKRGPVKNKAKGRGTR